MRIKTKHLIVLIPVVIVLVGGWRYRWVSDDASIDFRVIHNILHGYGPVYNPGERVEVYTDPLWLALLTIVSGVLTFISLQWWSVLLGLAFTGGGFWLAGLATMSIAQDEEERFVLPLGLICVSVVGGVWMFATSGLETGLIFGWLGLCWWLLVRTLRHENRGLYLTAAVLSLGFIIRPDMILFTIAEGIVLGVLLFRNKPPERSVGYRHVFLLGVLLFAVPLLSELLRIAYFGLLVSNTAIAKSAGSSYWSQGFTYAWDFIRPYFLFIPILFLGAIAVKRGALWWQRGSRLVLLVAIAPVIGGFLDSIYVIRVGGDFMHARMLLPGFFSIFAVVWIGRPRAGTAIFPSLGVGTIVWAALCLVSLRYTVPGIGPNMVANERQFYVNITGSAHPISPSDYPTFSWYTAGLTLRRRASGLSASEKIMTIGDTGVPGDWTSKPFTSELPEQLFASFGNIGFEGLAAGEHVYVFDTFSLANPIGAHFSVTVRGRPGHEKTVDPLWMIARFGHPYTQSDPLGATRQELIDAHAALQCQPLAGYLKSITGALTWRGILTNFEHAFTWTTMTFSSDPIVARHQLCTNVAKLG